jgi:hypothetical protein
MNIMSRQALLLISVGIMLILSACGGLGSDEDAAVAPSFRDSFGESGAVSDADSAFPDAEESVPPMEGDVPQLSGQIIDRRVIRTAELDLEVNDVERSIRFVRDTTLDTGGYVSSSTTRVWNDSESAELWIEVPSDRFDEVISRLREGPYVESVQRESTSSQDVTEEYIDLQSRIRNLEATERRYVVLLEDAVTIDEILRVEGELSRVRGQIEQIQGRINYLDQRTAYSRIYVSLIPTSDAIQIAGRTFTPLETAREAWNQSMDFISAVAEAGITIVVFFWWLWVLLAIVVAVVVRYRRRRGAAQPPAVDEPAAAPPNP